MPWTGLTTCTPGRYVVVRVWDLRRLVLPVSYFITTPFENWTRSTADILGWVFIEVDYNAPVEEIRAQFTEILSQSPDWDGKVSALQVTNLGSETMQLRALMSSPDSSKSWNLQCEVREKLVNFLQHTYPWALPRLRAELVDQLASGPHSRSASRPDTSGAPAAGIVFSPETGAHDQQADPFRKACGPPCRGIRGSRVPADG